MESTICGSSRRGRADRQSGNQDRCRHCRPAGVSQAGEPPISLAWGNAGQFAHSLGVAEAGAPTRPSAWQAQAGGGGFSGDLGQRLHERAVLEAGQMQKTVGEKPRHVQPRRLAVEKGFAANGVKA